MKSESEPTDLSLKYVVGRDAGFAEAWLASVGCGGTVAKDLRAAGEAARALRMGACAR
jgi:hypothetical protein